MKVTERKKDGEPVCVGRVPGGLAGPSQGHGRGIQNL